VPDPYYGGQRGFDHVIEILRDGCQGILASLEPKRQLTSAFETQEPNGQSSANSPHDTRMTSP
jgi:hypothetical protein